MYEFTVPASLTLEPPPPELEYLLGAMAGNQDAMDRRFKRGSTRG